MRLFFPARSAPSWGALLLVSVLCLSACRPAAEASAPAGSSPTVVSPSAAASTEGPTASPIPQSPIPPSAPVVIDDLPFDRYQWQQASIPIDEHSLLIDVAKAPFGWVAVGVRINWPAPGATFAPDDDPMANLYSGVGWTSADGLRWIRIPDGPQFVGSRITKVIGTATGALAFGLGGVCLPDACSGLPPNGGTIAWSSADGAAWERLEGTGLADGATVDVTATAGGLVAVGYVANDGSKPDNDAFSNPTDAAVWRSTDGRHWAAIGDLPVADRLFLVSGLGDTLVAIGSMDGATVTWISEDAGLTWENGPALDDGCCLSSSATRAASMVNVSWLDAGSSVDGIVRRADATSAAWSMVSPRVMESFRPVSVQAVGASFVVFGWTAHMDPEDGFLVDDEPMAFASIDGDAWTAVDLPVAWDGLAPIAVAGDGHQVVTIMGPLETFGSLPDTTSTTVWLGTAPD